VPVKLTNLTRGIALGIVLAVSALAITASGQAHFTPSPLASQSAAPSATNEESPTPTPAVGGPVTTFVTRSGTQLIDSGGTYRFRGLNLYNINGDGDCGYRIRDLDRELRAIGDSSNVIRGWFFQYLATNHRTGARDWSKMDATLAMLRKRGIRVVATLADEWGACEAAASRGPLQIGWYRHGYRRMPHSADVRASYREWVKEIVTRYRDDPTILAWQLMNEATAVSDASGSCPDQDAAGNALRAWAADMAALVKSLDPNHLLSIGTSGASQCGTAGARYRALYATPGVDLCESHDYSTPGVALLPGLASEIAACHALDKPIFVGEIGISGRAVGHDLRVRAQLLEAKVRAQLAAGTAGELVWAWRSLGDGGSSRRSYDVGPGDPILEVLEALPKS
jgi:endo-1,4-beta-mannosidase